MVALALFTMIRRPPLAGWIGGLAVVTKQYLILAVPLLLRFAARDSGGGTVRFGLRGVLAGTLLTLPFALWRLPSFIDSVVLLQAREPFRSDSLSYLSWAAREGWGTGSIGWAIAAACIALIVSARRTPNRARRIRGVARLVILRNVCLRFQGILQLLLLRRRNPLLLHRGPIQPRS
jgi:hypothetical protein